MNVGVLYQKTWSLLIYLIFQLFQKDFMLYQDVIRSLFPHWLFQKVLLILLSGILTFWVISLNS